MSKLYPVSWKEFVRRMQRLGFEGPFFGGKHPKMKRRKLTVIIPNEHDGDIGVGFLRRLLTQAGVTRKNGYKNKLGEVEAWLEAARSSGKPIPTPRYHPLIYQSS